MSQPYAPSSTMELGADAPLRTDIVRAATAVREHTPLAQAFTNFVTINFVANAQLAAGGAAAMSFLPGEVADMSRAAQAAYINVGTLMPSYEGALAQITHRFADEGIPWCLDPVGAGIGEARTRILAAMREVPPSVVRANASEVLALEAIWGLAPADGSDATQGPAGVESADEVDSAIEAACRVARHLRATRPDGLGAVAVSGELDLVTDGERVLRLAGGSPMMTKVTGMGCALGGVTATYLCEAEPLVAATAASVLFNMAGTVAGEDCPGPGTFHARFLDALWSIGPEALAQGSILEVE